MGVRRNIAKVVDPFRDTQTKDLLSPKVTSQGPKVTYGRRIPVMIRSQSRSGERSLPATPPLTNAGMALWKEMRREGVELICSAKDEYQGCVHPKVTKPEGRLALHSHCGNNGSTMGVELGAW